MKGMPSALAAFIVMGAALAAADAPPPTPRPEPSRVAKPAPSPKNKGTSDVPPASDPRLPEYCSLVRRCGLGPSGVPCPESASQGIEGVEYDAARCQEARTLVQRGITPADPRRYRVFRFLGRRYQVVFDLTGRLAISPARLSYLVDDLPLAARLMTHLRSVAYTAEYVTPDRVRFRATRADNLTTDAERISGATADGLLYYYGSGTSVVGPWRLRGQGMVEVRYWPGPGGRGLSYRIRILASPANAFLNAVMSMGLFKSAVKGKIDEVLADITGASATLDRQGMDAVSWTSWPPEEKKKVEELLAR